MNRRWKSEIQLLADMVATDLAQIKIIEPTCRCEPVFCVHEVTYQVWMMDVSAEWVWVDFIDSETAREVDWRITEMRLK